MSPRTGSPMDSQCNATSLDFPMLGRREILADFDGGDLTSHAGALLLRTTEQLTAIIRQFAACFTDHRNPDLIEHSVTDLLAQRVFGLALGYEDLNDHDDLRCDPLLAAVVGKLDPTGQTRQRRRDRGKALAGKSTLNRLELTPIGADQDSRYKKITCNSREALPPGPSRAARADRARPRRHRRPGPRSSARPLLPRLLQELLLSPTLHLLRRPPALRPAAALRYRRQRRGVEATEAPHHADPHRLAAGEDPRPRRQRVLP